MTALLQTTKAIAAPFQPRIKTFTEYCQEKSTLPKETKHTVEVLLEKAGTQDCQQANQRLSNLTSLSLGFKKIVNLQPLSSLSNLTFLNLGGNEIEDIQPLSNLTN
ncbi:MAG: leucine-rich repeat domain-containing protein [Rivularia sp. (in: cyanobacteria)]